MPGTHIDNYKEISLGYYNSILTVVRDGAGVLTAKNSIYHFPALSHFEDMMLYMRSFNDNN